MIDQLLQTIAPHYCCSCGEIGAVLCPNCKYDIVSERYSACIECERPFGMEVCGACSLPYKRLWCVAERRGSMKQLLNIFKFERAYAAKYVIAELVDESVPHLGDVTVVPVPTIAAHVRQRGYDHTYEIARQFARRRNLPIRRHLVRSAVTMQRGASRAVRVAQAQQAFIARTALPGGTYVLIDDIATTGATVRYAAQALREAGADEVWVAVVAHQPSTEDL